MEDATKTQSLLDEVLEDATKTQSLLDEVLEAVYEATTRGETVVGPDKATKRARN